MLHLPQWWYFNIYGWKDILELLIFSGAIYYVSLWLKQDRQKPLLFSFYGYCGSVLLCRMAQLDTTSTALLMLSPVLFVVFIVLHQHTLQRNFVALHALTPAHSPRNDWLEQFMRGCSNESQ